LDFDLAIKINKHALSNVENYKKDVDAVLTDNLLWKLHLA